MDSHPRENLMLEDTDPNKFIAKMGAEAIYDLLSRLDLDELSYDCVIVPAPMALSNAKPRL